MPAFVAGIVVYGLPFAWPTRDNAASFPHPTHHMLIKRKSIEQEESSRPARKPKFAPVTLSEQDGVRYLHFGTEWVQGAMRIRKPNWPELESARQAIVINALARDYVAKHPNAAKLTREYIFSDAGQLNLAKGNARPIRAETDLKLPAEIAKNLIPGEQYTKANPQPIKDADAWEATSKKLPQLWNEQVIVEMK